MSLIKQRVYANIDILNQIIELKVSKESVVYSNRSTVGHVWQDSPAVDWGS